MERTCPQCGYSTEGLPGDVCPECGLSYEEALRRNPKAAAISESLSNLLVTLILCFAEFVAISLGAVLRSFEVQSFGLAAVIVVGCFFRSKVLGDRKASWMLAVMLWMIVFLLGAASAQSCGFWNMTVACPMLIVEAVLVIAWMMASQRAASRRRVLVVFAIVASVTSGFYLWHGREYFMGGWGIPTELDGWRPRGFGPLNTRHAGWYGVLWLVVALILAATLWRPRRAALTPMS